MSVLNLLKLNKDFDGTETCPYCGFETDFKYNPVKGTQIYCYMCGKELLPCSLCEQAHGCNKQSCKQNILEALNEEIKEKEIVEV